VIGTGGREAVGAEARVLVVDDEESIVQLLCTALRYEGFATASAASGREALTQAAEFRPDLVLLDVMLPDIDGFEVHRRLSGATAGRLPVVFLTARRETDDRVRGLTIGADDYVVKPFSLEELIARVRAVLRRTRGEQDAARRLAFEDLELDEETREVRRGGRLVELTPTEFSLLRYLMVNAGRVLSKAQILDHVWNYDFGGDSNVVETYISYLRKKIDRDGEPLIHTVRGFGYALRVKRD
jgi:two-component system, OmpR family, response regulator